MTDIAPHPNPAAPIRKLVADDGSVSYAATCKVYGCNWSKTAPLRAILEPEKALHLHQHRARVPASEVWEEDKWYARCDCAPGILTGSTTEKHVRAQLKLHQAERHGVMW